VDSAVASIGTFMRDAEPRAVAAMLSSGVDVARIDGGGARRLVAPAVPGL